MSFRGPFFLFSSLILIHLTHSSLVPIPSASNTTSSTPLITSELPTPTPTNATPSTPNHDTTQIQANTKINFDRTEPNIQLTHDILSTYIQIELISTINPESDNRSTSKRRNNKFIQSMLSHEFLFATLISMASISCCLVILCVGIFNLKQNTKKKMLHNNISISADQQLQSKTNVVKDCDNDTFLDHIGIARNNKVKKHDYKQRSINLKISKSPASSNKSKSPLSKMLSRSFNISIPTSLNVELSRSESGINDIVEVTILNLEDEKQNIVSIDDIHATKNAKYNEYLTPTEVSIKQHKISCELNLILPDDKMDNSIMTGGDGDGVNLTHSGNNLSITKTYNISNSMHNVSVTRTYNGNNLLNV